ncbi:MAG: hypothetical protein FJ368_04345 [Pelagibacterales bacterium]|nr:hypothetical protein [Pelagibacterales bacterium]
MSAISNAYLIIFLPLIASLFSFLVPKKKIVVTTIVLTSLSLIALSCQNLLNVLAYKNISNNFDLGQISLGLEFSISAIGATFLLLAFFTKSIIFFFFTKDFENSLEEKNKIVFYQLYLFQFFAIAGIFTADSFFNIIIFVEIYILTIFALAEILLNQNRNNWRYFLFNSLVTILILFLLLVSQIIFSESNISAIAENISLILPSQLSFMIVFFAIIILALLSKMLFPYFSFKSENSKTSKFFLSELYFVKSAVAIFLTLKFSYVFFGNLTIELLGKVAPFLIFLSLSLVSYFALQLRKQNSYQNFFQHIICNNLAIVFVTLAISNLYSLQSLFFTIINFFFINLAFFFIFSLIEEKTDNKGQVFFILKRNFSSFFFPIKILLFFLSAFPLSFLFFSNWYLIKAAFDSIYLPLLFLIVAISNFSYVFTSLKLFEMIEIEEEKSENNFSNIASFLLLFAVIILLFASSDFLKNLSLEFALSLIP